MQTSSLAKTAWIIVIAFLAFAGLYYSKSFLVPLAMASLLSMLFLPMSRWFERRKVHRGLAIIVCILVLVLFFASIGALLAWQIADLSQDAATMEKNIMTTIGKAKQTLSNTLGISPEKQQEMMKKQQSSGGGSTSIVTAIMSSVMGILVDTILVLVYIFLLMFYRTRIKNFILMLVPTAEKPKTIKIIEDSSKVAFKYLSGLGFMIVLLWIMYGIGFSIAGVKNAFFFAVLCGTLEIIPFIGNITGTALTLLMGLTQGGGSKVIVGIIVTYVVVQFIQTYILEPLVVGAEVHINPLFTILVIVLAETVWGIPGMMLAVPILGIVKIICDNVEPLKPFGYLIGEDKKKNDANFITKVKGWFK